MPKCMHRIIYIGRDFWSSFGPTSISSQANLEQVDWGLVQLSFEYLQVFHNLWKTGTRVSESDWEDSFMRINSEFDLLQLMHIASCPVTLHLQESGFVSSVLSHWFVKDCNKVFIQTH